MEYKLQVLAILFTAFCVGNAEISSRINGGTEINYLNRNLFQYVVLIHANQDIVTCSGFVLNGTAVVTAASCFDSLNGVYDTVFVESDGSGNVYVHENYNKETKENNIAVILLNYPMLFQEGYTLPSAVRTVGSECIVAGYGSSLPEGQGSRLPAYENVTITDCEGTATGQICAGVKTDTDVHGILCLMFVVRGLGWNWLCVAIELSRWQITQIYGLIKQFQPSPLTTNIYKGDLGAPLTCNNELVGIAVSDSSCGTGGPDVYVDIITYKTWIENQISKRLPHSSSASSLVLNSFALIASMVVTFKRL